MKIIHCADLHLDSKLTANFSAEQAKERRLELLRTFERMIDFAFAKEVRAVIIAGDLFDTNVISATARNSVIGKIIAYPELDFYYLKGNHDVQNFLGDLEEIPANLKLFNENWHSYHVDPGMGSSVVITGAELDETNAHAIYGSLVLDNEDFNIVMLHGQESAYGAKDKTETINLGALRNKGIDYLALGHVHTYKEAPLDGRGRYCYSGCLEGRGFDETGACGFVLLDIDEEKKTCESAFIPFACRTLYAKEIDVSGCMTSGEIAARVQFGLTEEGYGSENMVKVLLTGSVDVECEKNMEYLKKYFSDQYYFFKVYDETKLAVDYQSFTLDKSLKGEFVRIVNAAADLDDNAKAEIIRYGIQALAGEEIG